MAGFSFLPQSYNCVGNSDSRAKRGKECSPAQPKSIKFVTSLDGQLDCVRNYVDQSSSFPYLNQSKIYRLDVYGTLQLIMKKFSCEGCILSPKPL